MAYSDIYNLRLNKYGTDYQSRMQGQREKMFDLYLQKVTTRISFSYNSATYIGSFERYKQDETETLHYLLTDISLQIPNGTILQLPNIHSVNIPWMVLYLEVTKASGYNKYVMLKMTHSLSWTDRSSTARTSYAYMHGSGDAALRDTQASSNNASTYLENSNNNYFIMPRNQYLNKGDYFIIGSNPYQQYFRVMGFDIQSTEGVEYVTVDPVYEYDLTAPPTQTATDDPHDFYWINGGSLDD